MAAALDIASITRTRSGVGTPLINHIPFYHVRPNPTRLWSRSPNQACDPPLPRACTAPPPPRLPKKRRRRWCPDATVYMIITGCVNLLTEGGAVTETDSLCCTVSVPLFRSVCRPRTVIRTIPELTSSLALSNRRYPESPSTSHLMKSLLRWPSAWRSSRSSATSSRESSAAESDLRPAQARRT